MSTRRSKRVLSWIGSFLISTLVFVGAFEAVRHFEYFRWKRDFDSYGWLGKLTVPSTNPALMWEYRPHGSYELVRTNRYGYRDRDYERRAKPAAVRRIAFAGDSVALGMGVSEDKTFVRQLEVALESGNPGRSIQTMNFAVDGYSALQVQELITDRVISFEPNVVVYVMSLNDFDFAESSGDKARYFQKPKSFTLLTLERLRRQLSGEDFHSYHFRRNKEQVFAAISRTKDRLEAAGCSFRMVIFPIFPSPPVTFSDYPLVEMHAEIAQFLVLNEIPFVDLLEDFVRTGKSPESYSFDIWHPNVEGHELAARAIATANLVGVLPPN